MKTQGAETARAIREELKKTFPKIKFSVTSKSYSGGNSVTAAWEDGVLVDDVVRVIEKYQYGNFDGMQDLYEYTNKRDDIPQVKYVFAERNMSEEARKIIAKKIQKDYFGDEEYDPNRYYEKHAAYGATLFQREFIKTAF